MRDLVKRNLNGKKVLLLFLLTNIIYVIMLTVTIPKVMSFSGGLKLLDMMPTGYDADYVNALLNALGENGRDAYLFNQIPLDMIYPFLFGISNMLILAYFLNKLGKIDSYLFYLCFLPLCSGLFDYGENIGIITMLTDYPNNSNMLTQASSVFSVLKSFSTTAYFIILISCLVVWSIRKAFHKNSPSGL